MSPNLTCGCRIQMLENNTQVLRAKGMVLCDCQVLYSCTTKKNYFFTSTLTPFENFGQILVGTRVCWSFVTFLITKYATSVNPVIIMWPKKLNRKLARLMTHVLNVCWDIAWITDLCWPPSTDMHKTTLNELTKIATELDSIEVNSSCHISLIENWGVNKFLEFLMHHDTLFWNHIY